MTTQIPDYVTYNQKEFRIVGIQGHRLLHVSDFDVAPTSAASNCWRGFHMGYTIIQNQLIATRLTVLGQVMSVVDGVHPAPGHVYESAGRTRWSDTEWMGIQREVPLNGKIIIANDLIYDMVIQMGCQKPPSFRNVLELTLDDGCICDINNISAPISLLREKILEITCKNKSREEKEQDIQSWVTNMFSLKYDSWWWN